MLLAELSMPKISMLKPSPLVPQNVTLIRNGIIADEVKMQLLITALVHLTRLCL